MTDLSAPHDAGNEPTVIVLHATVSGTARGIAAAIVRFFRRKGSDTSAHRVADAGGVKVCLPDNVVAWHCGHNRDTLGLEMCIYPLLSAMTNWLKPKSKRNKIKQHARMVPLSWLRPSVRAMMRHSADQVADWCIKRNIPVRYLTREQLLAWEAAGHPAHLGGIVTHAQMSSTFHGSTHWDPGMWPKGRFLKMVRTAVLAELHGPDAKPAKATGKPSKTAKKATPAKKAAAKKTAKKTGGSK
jgi:hypothetical protein